MSTKKFEEKLKLGKSFEPEAQIILTKQYPKCVIQDTSEIHRWAHKGKEVQFPDFIVSFNDRPVKLYDAKFKKVYYSKGSYYLPVDISAIADYLFVAESLEMPCGLIFKVNEQSRSHVGKIFIVYDVAKTPYMAKPFNNEHGDDDSCWYNLDDLAEIDPETFERA